MLCCAVHLAICIEVGVESDGPVAGGLEVDEHGVVGVAGREENIKHKTAIGIGSVCWSSDEHLHTHKAGPHVSEALCMVTAHNTQTHMRHACNVQYTQC